MNVVVLDLRSKTLQHPGHRATQFATTGRSKWCFFLLPLTHLLDPVEECSSTSSSNLQNTCFSEAQPYVRLKTEVTDGKWPKTHMDNTQTPLLCRGLHLMKGLTRASGMLGSVVKC